MSIRAFLAWSCQKPQSPCTADDSASKIAGGKWNAPDTYYTIRDKVFSGNTIDDAHIEKGMCVWMKK